MTKEWQAVVQLTSSAACAKHARVVLTPVDSFAVRALIWKRTCAGAIRPGHNSKSAVNVFFGERVRYLL